jgi:hypothetical protein
MTTSNGFLVLCSLMAYESTLMFILGKPVNMYCDLDYGKKGQSVLGPP